MLGYIYLWRDRKRKMFYLGSHIGSEHDGYIGSGKRFTAAYKKRPEDFKRRILERVEFESLDGCKRASHPVRIVEQRWLNMIKLEELDGKYYNFHLSASGHTRESAIAALATTNSIKDERGKSLNSVRRAMALHSIKDERGKSVVAVNWGRKGSAKVYSIKDENGKSVHSIKALTKRHAIKDERGKSIIGVNWGRKGAIKLHAEKDEDGKSVHAIKASTAANLAKDKNGKSAAAVKSNHNRWHIKRNRINPNCSLCEITILDY
jgi:hypothetical protein